MSDESITRRCRHCAERIQPDARVCPHCRRDQEWHRRALIGIIASGFLMAMFFGAWMAVWISTDVVRNQARAVAIEVASEIAIEIATTTADNVARGASEEVWRSAVRDLWLAREAETLPAAVGNLEEAIPLEVNIEEGENIMVRADEIVRLRFEIREDGIYRIDAIAAEGEGRFDPLISLFGENLDFIQQDDDGGSGFNSRMEVRLAQGRYFLELEELGGRRGECRISVRAVGQTP